MTWFMQYPRHTILRLVLFFLPLSIESRASRFPNIDEDAGFGETRQHQADEDGAEKTSHPDGLGMSSFVDLAANGISAESSALEMDAFLSLGELDVQVRDGLQWATEALLNGKQVGCDRDASIQVTSRHRDVVVQLTDHRACWPHLGVEGACPNLQGLLAHLKRRPSTAERVASGNSGSQILLAPKREHEYVVKSVKDREVMPIRSVLLKGYADEASGGDTILHNPTDASSLITPVCFTATLQYKTTGWMIKSTPAPETWIVMRRLRLSVDEEQSIAQTGKKPEMFDVKGPTWVSWDGKSRMRGNSKVKDRGFKQRFPQGLELAATYQGTNCMPCSSIFQSLFHDAAIMESMAVTDYSLLMMIHDSSNSVAACPKRDGFPIYAEATDPRTGRKHLIALGIIDYGETTVASSWKVASTMLAPSEYRQEFSAIFGQGNKAGKREAYLRCGL